MNNTVVIPARGGSKGIKRKNLAPFCGKPLLEWTIRQALDAENVTIVYVSTEDFRIAEVANKAGAEVIKRPEELATDTSGMPEVLLDTLSVIQRPDNLIMLQPTSPLREAVDIDNAIAKMDEYDSVFSVTRRSTCFMWRKHEGKLQPMNYVPTNRPRRQEYVEQNGIEYNENGSIYVCKPELLETTKNYIGGNIGISLMEQWKEFEIDSQEDLEFCKMVFREKLMEG